MTQNRYLFASIAAGVAGAVGIVAGVAALDGGTSHTDEPVDGQPGGNGDVTQDGLHRARLDLARRLDIDPADVTMVSIRHTGWDGCLGVYVENGVCTEIFIAGTVAIFHADGKDYRYHLGGDRFIATDFEEGRVDNGTPLPPDMVPDPEPMLSEYLRGDLALGRDADLDDVSVDEFRKVRWGDGCMGVYHPAAICLAGIVDGYRAVLSIEGDDRDYVYHGALAGQYVAVWALDPGAGYIVGEPLDDLPGNGGRIKEPRQAMVEDLAGQLGVDMTRVTVTSFAEVTWPDGCVGVYRPDSACTQALVDGWLATLTVPGESREYRYHGSYDGGFIAVWSIDEPGIRIGDPIER